MAGLIEGVVLVEPQAAAIAPVSCPGGAAMEERGEEPSSVACWKQSDVWGRLTCPFMLGVARWSHHTRRYDDPLHAADSLRQEARMRGRVKVICQMAKANGLRPGA